MRISCLRLSCESTKSLLTDPPCRSLCSRQAYRVYTLCITEARLAVNVALRRPSSQISVYCNRFGCHGAYKANDGHLYLSHPLCSHTGYHLHPWWAVDLGLPLYVDAVNVTSRGDCCGEQQDRIRIYHICVLLIVSKEINKKRCSTNIWTNRLNTQNRFRR